MPGPAQSKSNACLPVAARLRNPKRRSVNSFPLSVNTVRMRIGQAHSTSREAGTVPWPPSWP